MSLSNDLISQFVKVTTNKDKKSESTVYGTYVDYDGEKYVRFDGSDLLTPVTSTTNAKDGDRVTVSIKNHTATVTGNITSPSATNSEFKEIGSKISDFEIVIADKVSTIELDAERARIDNLEVGYAEIDTLKADNVTIKNTLTAANADIDKLTADNVSINRKLTAAEADIITLNADKLDADVADIKFATIENLEATNGDFYNLEATYSNFEKATINDLTVIRASISTLESEKANIDDLVATNIKFDTASGEIIDVQTLLSQFTTGQNAQYLNITSSNAVFGDAIIKDAMIDNVSASKLTTGKLNTNEITIESDDNSLKIEDGTIQFSDKDGNVRLQLGEDTTGDFNFILKSTDGTTVLIDSMGVKENAIADKLIKTDMIDDGAVGSKQINYESFISGLNEDGSGDLIKSSKVELDGTGQTLNVAFESIETSIDEVQNRIDNIEIPEGIDSLKEQVTTNTTDINVMNGEISTLITETDLIKTTVNDVAGEVGTINTEITEINNNYSGVSQRIDSISANISSHESQITEINGDIDSINEHVSTNETDIQLLKNKIDLKVEQTDIDTAVEKVQNDVDVLENSVKDTTTNMSSLSLELDSITNRVSSAETHITEINGDISDMSSRVSTAESKLTPEGMTMTISESINNGGSIDTTCYTMNSDGLFIRNGALYIQNNDGETVLEGDSNGNLNIRGSITINTDKREQLRVESDNSDVPILVARDYGIFAKTIQVADSLYAWENNRYYGGSAIDTFQVTTPKIVATDGDITRLETLRFTNHMYTASSGSNKKKLWANIALMEVNSADEDSYIAISISGQEYKKNTNERAILVARLFQNGTMGVEDNIYFSMNLQQSTPNISKTMFKGKVTNCNENKTTIEIYMQIQTDYTRYYIQRMDYYGNAITLQNQPLLSDPYGHKHFTCDEYFYNRNLSCNCLRTMSSYLDLLVSNESSSSTGITISSTGTVKFIKSGTAVHTFNTSGTKTGGSMEIEGIRYGMSPTDSPQTLIEYIVPDVNIDGELQYLLDEIYKQMISYYIVISSNPDIKIKEKTSDYITLSGTGVTDLLIKGQRKNAEEYFRIMSGLDVYSIEEEENQNGITEINND